MSGTWVPGTGWMQFSGRHYPAPELPFAIPYDDDPRSPYYHPRPVEVVQAAPAVPVVELTPVEWLQAFIADGPKAAKEVFATAKARGFGRKRILTAQKRLGIKPAQSARTWFWSLPGWSDDSVE